MHDIDKIRIVEIEESIDESATVRTLIFKDEISASAKAGQFLMVWNPSIDELPMSVMLPYDYDSKRYSAISIRRHGESSTSIYNKKKGDVIGIRGPYGTSFTMLDGNLLLVGGGTGLVPLLRLCKALIDEHDVSLTLIMGYRSKDEIIYEKLASSLLSRIDGRLIITTDDGSYGIKGTVIDPLNRLLKEERFYMIYTCGPELMMKKVLELAVRYGIKSEASLERIMKCGIGLCSSCSLGPYILCKDGPVMNGSNILAIDEFGRYYRDKSGRLRAF